MLDIVCLACLFCLFVIAAAVQPRPDNTACEASFVAAYGQTLENDKNDNQVIQSDTNTNPADHFQQRSLLRHL